jgi:hypothetical protein
MEFSNNNSYFISQKLYSEMRGLSDLEKMEKYILLKEEVYKRLKESYFNCSSKSSFYKDIFQVLGLYDGDYLILNLLLDEDCIEIINDLKKINIFEDEVIKVTNANLISYSFFNVIKKDLCFTEDKLVTFLKDNIIELTQTIKVNDWRNDNEKSNPLIRKIIKSITLDNNENSIFIYFLFVKIWNYFDEFSKPFNNTKGIAVYYNLIESLNKVDGHDFFDFYRELEELPRHLFVNPSYFPIIDNKNDSEYKTGYMIRRTDFFKIIESLRNISEISTLTSFVELIKIYSNSEDIKLVEICKETIMTKLNLLEYPITDEIIYFKDTEFYKNLYIY